MQKLSIPIPEFKPKAPEVQDDGSSRMVPEAEPEPPRPADFAMKVQLEPNEDEFTGKLMVNTGDSMKIMNLFSWQTVEEREQKGEQVQVIEGTLDTGNDPINPDYQSQINGTLTPDGNDLILEAHGTAGSPYTYVE